MGTPNFTISNTAQSSVQILDTQDKLLGNGVIVRACLERIMFVVTILPA